MHGVMSSSVRGLLCAAVVVAAGALAGCTVYVQRAESAYHSGRYLEVAEVLAEDAKNYHAWGHRQWVLKHFSLWEGELEYIDTLLAQDVRNNSAWNQRYYVLKHTADLTSHDVVGSELAYALRHIEGEPDNPSPWAYLKGGVEYGFSSTTTDKEQALHYAGVSDGANASIASTVFEMQMVRG